jgi:hypothetical protein
MRRYDDLVQVRRGMVPVPGEGRDEGPEQFLWRGRLWKVSAVLAHWVQTGPWWQSPSVHAVLGTDADRQGRVGLAPDLLAEREVWRVEAARGRLASGTGTGVFDLVLDWSDGSWRLVGCVD